MRKFQPLFYLRITILLISALFFRPARAASNHPDPIDSTFKDWYYTPTGVFGRSPILKPLGRTYVRISQINDQLFSIQKYNPAGTLLDVIHVRFFKGNLNLITETNQWGECFDSIWFKPDAPNEYIVTEKLRGQNPYMPCKAVRFNYKNNLLLEIHCLMDSTHPGYNQDGISIYKFERYEDQQRFSLIKSESYYDVIYNPVLSRSSKYHKIVNEYGKDGNLDSRSVYGIKDEPAIDKSGAFKTKFHYDRNDYETEIDYFDNKGSLVYNIFGYSRFVREFKNGFPAREIFYDDEYTKIRSNRLADSVSVIEYKFDENGNEIEKGYFDAEDRSMNNFKGIHKTSFEYSSSGMLVGVSHFDIHSFPVSDEAGIHRYLFTRDEKGRLISTAFFNMIGKPLKNYTDGVYVTKFGYDDWGRVVSTSFWENDSTKMLGLGGYHVGLARYNQYGEIAEVKFLDKKGQSTIGRLGYSRLVLEYNDEALVLDRKYFDGDRPSMEEDQNSDASHFHNIQYNYDLFNRVRSIEFYDTSNEPVNAKIRLDNGLEIKSQRVRFSYDGSQMTEQRFYDSDGAAPPVIRNCLKGNCLSLSGNVARRRLILETNNPLSQNRTYQGSIQSDSMLFGDQMAFLNHDSILIFLNASASFLVERPCASLYRIAHVNKYYQLNGEATDYYMDNDSMASHLTYYAGNLNGQCTYYYKNGNIKEKGEYLKNGRVGSWDYFYENGRKEKTINFTDKGAFLMESYTQSGKSLVQNGNGNFEGMVVIGTADRPMECRITGNIKKGLQDGEWKIYNNLVAGPSNIEKFSSGRFSRGTSFSKFGEIPYEKRNISRFESIHPGDRLDHYGQNSICSVVGARSMKANDIVSLVYSNQYFSEINQGFRNILSTSKYKEYSGWVFLDIKYDENGEASQKYVRLFKPNAEFEKDILEMLSNLKTQSPQVFSNNKIPSERFYIVLVESNEVVIPEDLLRKSRNMISQ